MPVVCKPLLCAGKERSESGGATNLRRDGRDMESIGRRSGIRSNAVTDSEIELRGPDDDLPHALKLRLGEYA